MVMVMTKMAAMPIYGKNLKNLLWNRLAGVIETWYVALDTQVLRNCSNDDTKWTFDLFI